MDELRDRYRVPQQGNRPAHVPEALRHAYQPAPQAPTPRLQPRPHQPQPQPRHEPRPIQKEPLIPSEHRRPEPANPYDYHHEPKAHHQPAAKRRRRPGRKLAVSLVLLIAVIAAGAFAYPKYAQANPFTPDIQQKVNFSLFYPTKLPPDYSIDKSNIKFTNGVLIYAATNGDLRIVFTVQQTPKTFDFNSFYKQQLTDTRRVNTKYGQATIGKNNGRYLGSLVDGQTWVIVSDNNPAVSADDIATAISNLKKY